MLQNLILAISVLLTTLLSKSFLPPYSLISKPNLFSFLYCGYRHLTFKIIDSSLQFKIWLITMCHCFIFIFFVIFIWIIKKIMVFMVQFVKSSNCMGTCAFQVLMGICPHLTRLLRPIRRGSIIVKWFCKKITKALVIKQNYFDSFAQ